VRTLLFLNYWSLHEPLTQSTVLPTLRMVLQEGMAERVVLVTVERGTPPAAGLDPLPDGVVHVPLHAARGPRVLARAYDRLTMVPRIAAIARREGAAFIMARSVVAGGFAHGVHRRTGIPYAVDYFEPHNEYMVEVGEWTAGGVMDRSLRRMIQDQLRTATACVTVAANYRDRLIAEGADPSRLHVAPCPVDAARMRPDPAARERVRSELGWSDAVVGVYLGKFGGLYHRERSFAAFARTALHFGDRYALLVLTPEPAENVRSGLQAAGYAGRSHIRYAPHAEVPAYLSAADLAFAPYRGTRSSACISPMKIGEYWSSGLPVLLTRGVGDDSAIIAADPDAGAVFDPEGDDLDAALVRLEATLRMPGQRERTQALAARYRSMDITRTVYRRILPR
jgi:glycosyltransferase involved in cell wall biosynthesis